MSDTACGQGSRLSKVALTLGLKRVCGPASLQHDWSVAEEATREFTVDSSAGPSGGHLTPCSLCSTCLAVLCGQAWPLQRLWRISLHDTNRPLQQISCPHEVTSYSFRPVFSWMDTPWETGTALLALPTGFSPVLPARGGVWKAGQSRYGKKSHSRNAMITA